MSRFTWIVIAVGLCLAGVCPAQEQSAAKIPATSQATKEFVYKKTEQAELKLLVDVPEDWKASDRRAAIVFFFGGGWNGGKIEQFEDQARYLASRGMVAAR